MYLKLINFDGPLDLLLHLIRVQDLNIFNIPIITITEQFLNFLKNSDNLDFPVAGEYLAMAAQLIEIKANLLIPILQKQEAQCLEEMISEDPRRPLVEQLLEFEELKNASSTLIALSTVVNKEFKSGEYKRREEEFEKFEAPLIGNSFELVLAFEKVLLRFKKQILPKITIHSQSITIQQKISFIQDELKNLKTILTLKTLLNSCLSRYEVIVTIMALLELCKERQIQLEQKNNFSEIMIMKNN